MTIATSSLSDIRAQLDADKIEEAQAALNSVKETDENRAEVLFLRGRAKERSFDREGALAVYHQVLELDPDNIEVTFRAAVLSEQCGDENAALELYKNCVSVSPAPVNALINLAIMLEERGNLEEAEARLLDVLGAYPNHVRAQQLLKSVESSYNMVYNEQSQKDRERHSALLDMPISDFELSVRSRNCLRQMNIATLRDLLKTTESELLSYKNFGETSLHEINAMLTQRGLKLGQALRPADAVAALFKSPPASAGETPSLDPGRPIAELELSVRSRKALQRLGVTTISDLTKRSEAELMYVKNFGQTSLDEIQSQLAKVGLSLRQPGA